MKPAFALDFRDGAVAVLHRTARGWIVVGQTSFDSPDLDEALSFLRSTALGLSPGGVATKLIIPNDQIKYLTIRAPGPDAAKRRRQIATALEGRTPYPVADLVFDWWGKGDEVTVAVIARETLAEAEGFAHSHRFNPLAFVAVPDNGLFQGEPWFGPTTVADQILAAGEKVDRDQDPVRILGRDAGPGAGAGDVVPDVVPVPPADPVPMPAPNPLPVPAPEPEPEPAPPPEPMPEPPPEPMPGPLPDPTPAPLGDPASDPVNSGGPTPETAPQPAAIAHPAPMAEPVSMDRRILPDTSTPAPIWQPEALAPQRQPWEPADGKPAAFTPQMPAGLQADAVLLTPAEATPFIPVPAPEEAPMALDVIDGQPDELTDDQAGDLAKAATVSLSPQPLAGVARGNAASADKEPTANQGFSLLRAFTTRRKPAATTAPSKPEPLQPAPLKAEPGLATFSAAATAARNPVPPPVAFGTRIGSVTDPDLGAEMDIRPDRPKSASESSGMAVIGATRNPATLGKLTADRPTLARPLPGGSLAKSAPAKGGKGLKGFGAFVTSPSINGPKRPRVATPPQAPGTPPSANPSGVSPARPGTRPIGLGAKPLPQKGKPRFLGLVLTGILLVLLALVAAWSTFFLAFNTEATTTTAVAELEQPATADIPAPEDEMLADLQDPADFTEAEATQDPGVSDPGGQDPDADLALTKEPAAAATPDPAALETAPDTGLVSETGTATASPAGDAQDEIFLAAIDSPPQPPDPSALGAPSARPDALPSPAVPPPPFGTVYQFDADGRIIPTPEGIATPEGVLLVAGPPSVVPTSRPDAVVAAALAATLPATASAPEAGAGNPSTVVTDPAAAAAATPIAPVFADPALQGLRPQPRPSGLQVPSQNGAAEDPALAPNSDSRFASLRPQPRPSAIAALAAPTVDDAAIEAAVQSASLMTQGEVLPQDSNPLTVAVSRVPAARPKGLDTASASAAAIAASAPAEQVAANVAPEADAEPEHTGAMPSLPTTASVAKQATVKDAVNLSKLTLIGIFGSDGRRYALVRQPNGRLLKVKVGDKLDGGKVAAITTTELTYQKGGRAVTLEMPRT